MTLRHLHPGFYADMQRALASQEVGRQRTDALASGRDVPFHGGGQ
jgi:hypothetical protein